jgi:hypothetical protein
VEFRKNTLKLRVTNVTFKKESLSTVSNGFARNSNTQPQPTLFKFNLKNTVGVLGFDSRGGGAGNSSVHHRVQNGSGAHTVSYPMGTKGSLPWGKAVGA